MLLAIELVVHGLNSLRGVVRCLQIFRKTANKNIPCHVSVQNWVLAYGLHQLQQANERQDDWIYILDFTIGLGSQKFLLILGVRMSRLRRSGSMLSHQDVTVLRIVVCTCSSGEMIAAVLEEVSAETSPPKQVVSDHGSDVKKGAEIFCQRHLQTVYTYDITHKTAISLKHIMAEDKEWEGFVKLCADTKRKTAQSDVAFLAPPKPAEKARWLNVGPFVKWAESVLAYQEKGKFQQINPNYQLTVDSLEALKEHGSHALVERLTPLVEMVFPNAETFLAATTKICSTPLPHATRKLILHYGDCGRRKFEKYFAWLNDFRDELRQWKGILAVLQLAKDEVKRNGLRRESPDAFREQVKSITVDCERQRNLIAKINDFLQQESESIPESEIWLGCSDIIESIFAKYKNFSSRSALKGVGKMILSIPVFTTKLTTESVRKAMEKLRHRDVSDWLGSTLGRSLFSIRKEALGTAKRKNKGKMGRKLLPKVVQI